MYYSYISGDDFFRHQEPFTADSQREACPDALKQLNALNIFDNPNNNREAIDELMNSVNFYVVHYKGQIWGLKMADTWEEDNLIPIKAMVKNSLHLVETKYTIKRDGRMMLYRYCCWDSENKRMHWNFPMNNSRRLRNKERRIEPQDNGSKIMDSIITYSSLLKPIRKKAATYLTAALKSIADYHKRKYGKLHIQVMPCNQNVVDIYNDAKPTSCMARDRDGRVALTNTYAFSSQILNNVHIAYGKDENDNILARSLVFVTDNEDKDELIIAKPYSSRTTYDYAFVVQVADELKEMYPNATIYKDVFDAESSGCTVTVLVKDKDELVPYIDSWDGIDAIEYESLPNKYADISNRYYDQLLLGGDNDKHHYRDNGGPTHFSADDCGDRVYIPNLGEYVPDDEAVYIEEQDEYYHIEDYDIVYDDGRARYIHLSDYAWSEYHDSYVAEDDAVYSQTYDSQVDIHHEDIVYSDIIKDYIDVNDDDYKSIDVIESTGSIVGSDYVPVNDEPDLYGYRATNKKYLCVKPSAFSLHADRGVLIVEENSCMNESYAIPDVDSWTDYVECYAHKYHTLDITGMIESGYLQYRSGKLCLVRKPSEPWGFTQSEFLTLDVPIKALAYDDDRIFEVVKFVPLHSLIDGSFMEHFELGHKSGVKYDWGEIIHDDIKYFVKGYTKTNAQGQLNLMEVNNAAA